MRFVKPLKGFRISRNLGILLFSTAVISGQLPFENIAYGLEAPIIPPSVVLASTKTNNEVKNDEAKVAETKVKEAKTTKVDKVAKTEKIEKVSKSSSDISNSVIKKDDSSKLEKVKEEKNIGEKTSEKPIPESTFQSPILPPPIVNQNNNFNDDSLEEDDDFSISEKKDEVKTLVIANAKVESKSELKSEVKSEVKVPKEIKKSDNNDNQKMIIKKQITESKGNDSTKELDKSSDKPSKKVSELKTVDTKITAPLVAKEISVKNTKIDSESSVSRNNNSAPKKKVSRKTVKEDNVCPPEWDWFSAPLVFVKDANGKMVIRADKNAPKIVIGRKKENNKALMVVEPKPVNTKKAVVKKSIKKQNKVLTEEYVEAKPIEAPAAEIKAIESEPVVELNNNEVVEIKETTKVEPIVAISDSKTSEESVNKPLFTEASRKMARIKRLHHIDNSEIEVQSLQKSTSMVRMNKLVKELIQRADNHQTQKTAIIMTDAAPNAPPVNKVVVGNNSDNNNSTNSGVKYAFRPYINPEAYYLRTGVRLRYSNLYNK